MDIKTGTTDDRNNERDDSLSRCVSRECSAVLRIESDLSSIVRYAAVRGRVQNMIVGGGCSGSSSSSEAVFLCFDLDLRGFREGFAGSGGARRRWMVDSGGLQSI